MFVFRPWTPKHAYRHRPDTYDEMDAAAKRKATIDTKKIIAEVKTIAKKLDSDKAELVEHIDESKGEIIGHVDAVGAKVDGIRKRDKRKFDERRSEP